MPRLNTTLLIVDDEPSTRTSLTHIFAAMGHNVRSAEDGFSALSEIWRQTPDVLLSDLNMPGMSGFELLSVVRRLFPMIQVIAMSGAFSGDGVQPGVAADAFYQKGANLRNLLHILETVLTGIPRVRPTSAPVPIWIPKSEPVFLGDAYVTISCPDCLRTFPQAHDEAISVIKETRCAHCFSVIHYGILQPTNPAGPQIFQRKPVISDAPSRYSVWHESIFMADAPRGSV
jgi:CheY-like chemotaxis protein